MNAAFVKNDRVVYLETDRVAQARYLSSGVAERPGERDRPAVPRSKNGHTFYAQRGGDTFIDPTWQSDLEASVKAQLEINPTDRAADFELAKEAATAIGTAAPASFKSHVFYLKNFAPRRCPEGSR